MTEEAKVADEFSYAIKVAQELQSKMEGCAGSVDYLCSQLRHAVNLIESLSAENEILNAAIGQLGAIECHRDMLEHELEQVTRERDAAIRDIDEAAPCFACIRFERNGGDCIGAHVCIDDILQEALGGKYADYYWQWRGVEVTDDAQKGSDAKS